MPSEEKPRLDVLLVELGLAPSREQAQAGIIAGRVMVDGRRVDKPGTRMKRTAQVEMRKAESEFVGRGGHKLAGALAQFQIDVTGRVCLDVGASTGGFTDCLLQRGAALVHAVDVGHGQLAWKLRCDPRVVVREKVNARYLAAADFDPRPTLAVIDVSFISLELILGPVAQVLLPPREIVCLIKPQFEIGREEVPRGGVVKDPDLRERAVEKIRRFVLERLGAQWNGCAPSTLQGTDGNQEYLAWITDSSGS